MSESSSASSDFEFIDIPAVPNGNGGDVDSGNNDPIGLLVDTTMHNGNSEKSPCPEEQPSSPPRFLSRRESFDSLSTTDSVTATRMLQKFTFVPSATASDDSSWSVVQPKQQSNEENDNSSRTSWISNFEILSLGSGKDIVIKKKCKRCGYHNDAQIQICQVCCLALVANPSVEMDLQIALSLQQKEVKDAHVLIVEMEQLRARLVAPETRSKVSLMDKSNLLMSDIQQVLLGSQDHVTMLRKVDFLYWCSTFISVLESRLSSSERLGSALCRVDVGFCLCSSSHSVENVGKLGLGFIPFVKDFPVMTTPPTKDTKQGATPINNAPNNQDGNHSSAAAAVADDEEDEMAWANINPLDIDDEEANDVELGKMIDRELFPISETASPRPSKHTMEKTNLWIVAFLDQSPGCLHEPSRCIPLARFNHYSHKDGIRSMKCRALALQKEVQHILQDFVQLLSLPHSEMEVLSPFQDNNDDFFQSTSGQDVQQQEMQENYYKNNVQILESDDNWAAAVAPVKREADNKHQSKTDNNIIETQPAKENNNNDTPTGTTTLSPREIRPNDVLVILGRHSCMGTSHLNSQGNLHYQKLIRWYCESLEPKDKHDLAEKIIQEWIDFYNGRFLLPHVTYAKTGNVGAWTTACRRRAILFTKLLLLEHFRKMKKNDNVSGPDTTVGIINNNERKPETKEDNKMPPDPRTAAADSTFSMETLPSSDDDFEFEFA